MSVARTMSARAAWSARRLGWASLLVLGIVAAGCARTNGGIVPAAGAPSPTVGQHTVAPGVTVSCAPGQRTLVRPGTANGQPVTDVQCVDDQASAAPLAGMPPAGPATVAPVAYVDGSGAVSNGAQAPVAYAAPYAPGPVNAWAPASPRPRARTVAYRTDGDTLTYEPRSPRRVVRQGRSWKKSAVIVGSSAGLGAGIGAAIGGKKGALIGAALGGGSAAIWDQATRR